MAPVYFDGRPAERATLWAAHQTRKQEERKTAHPRQAPARKNSMAIRLMPPRYATHLAAPASSRFGGEGEALQSSTEDPMGLSIRVCSKRPAKPGPSLLVFRLLVPFDHQLHVGGSACPTRLQGPANGTESKEKPTTPIRISPFNGCHPHGTGGKRAGALWRSSWAPCCCHPRDPAKTGGQALSSPPLLQPREPLGVSPCEKEQLLGPREELHPAHRSTIRWQRGRSSCGKRYVMPTALTTRKLKGHTCVGGEERADFSEDGQRQGIVPGLRPKVKWPEYGIQRPSQKIQIVLNLKLKLPQTPPPKASYNPKFQQMRTHTHTHCHMTTFWALATSPNWWPFETFCSHMTRL